MSNIKRNFKLSKRFIWMKSLSWILGILFLLGLVIFTQFERLILSRDLQLFHDLKLEEAVFLLGCASVLTLRILVMYLYWRTFSIRLSREGITVGRGIIFQHLTTIPLDHISQIDVGQNLLHKLFGLKYLEIFSFHPSAEKKRSASLRLEGMNRSDVPQLLQTIRRRSVGAPAHLDQKNPDVLSSYA